MKGTELIFQIINNLTEDEDYRQDLWVYLLEGNSPKLLRKHLKNIKEQREKYEDMQTKIQDFFSIAPSETFLGFLENFSDLEYSIIFMMVLGYSPEEISELKNVDTIKIMQAITTIKNNPAWIIIRGYDGTQA